MRVSCCLPDVSDIGSPIPVVDVDLAQVVPWELAIEHPVSEAGGTTVSNYHPSGRMVF